MIPLHLNQKLIRKTRPEASFLETETVVSLFDLEGVPFVQLSNGERIARDGWYFDPNNPSHWVPIEEPKAPEPRTIDEVFDNILELGALTENAYQGERDDEKIEALRAELKTLVSCEECGDVCDQCSSCYECEACGDRDSRP